MCVYVWCIHVCTPSTTVSSACGTYGTNVLWLHVHTDELGPKLVVTPHTHMGAQRLDYGNGGRSRPVVCRRFTPCASWSALLDEFASTWADGEGGVSHVLALHNSLRAVQVVLNRRTCLFVREVPLLGLLGRFLVEVERTSLRPATEPLVH